MWTRGYLYQHYKAKSSFMEVVTIDSKGPGYWEMHVRWWTQEKDFPPIYTGMEVPVRIKLRDFRNWRYYSVQSPLN